MAEINFVREVAAFKIPRIRETISMLMEIAEREHKTVEKIVYYFVSDERLHELNQQHLQHDTLTDIVTFDYSYTDHYDNLLLVSEVYVSVDRVKENAVTFNTDFGTELKRVLFHGILHLCGYKDKSPVEQKQMREKEDFYLDAYAKKFAVPRKMRKRVKIMMDKK
jgi:probable rRNA maturation factor